MVGEYRWARGSFELWLLGIVRQLAADKLSWTGQEKTTMKSRPHLLIVDDDALILDVARDILSPDYHLFAASNSLECVDLLLTERIDLLIIDTT